MGGERVTGPFELIGQTTLHRIGNQPTVTLYCGSA